MSPDRRALLEALGTLLRVHFFVAAMRPDGLRVSNPGTSGCCDPHPSTVITVVQRADDGGLLWYATTWRYWLAPSDRRIDVLTAVQGLLNGRPGVIV